MNLSGAGETIQKLFTINQRIDTLKEDLKRDQEERRRFADTVAVQIERLNEQLSDLRERVVRLEERRAADRSEWEASFQKFLLQAERLVIRVEATTPQAQLLPPTPGDPVKRES